MDKITNQMKKERHIKTFPEKFGHINLYNEAMNFVIENNKKYTSIELFNKMPYVGYLRIDTDNPDFFSWWYESEDVWIQAKVVAVNDKKILFYHYDSHHYCIAWRNEEYEGFAVQGNVLIKLGDL